MGAEMLMNWNPDNEPEAGQNVDEEDFGHEQRLRFGDREEDEDDHAFVAEPLTPEEWELCRAEHEAYLAEDEQQRRQVSVAVDEALDDLLSSLKSESENEVAGDEPPPGWPAF